MQSAQKKSKQNGNGNIVPLKSGQGIPVKPEVLEVFRLKDVEHEISALGKSNGDSLKDSAAYNRHPEVRMRALEMLSNDKHALRYVVFVSPYPDTVKEANKMLNHRIAEVPEAK